MHILRLKIITKVPISVYNITTSIESGLIGLPSRKCIKERRRENEFRAENIPIP